MSWITDLLATKGDGDKVVAKKSKSIEYIYLSIQSNYICILIIDEATDIGNIVEKQEIFLGVL